jgi:hypothetical protein
MDETFGERTLASRLRGVLKHEIILSAAIIAVALVALLTAKGLVEAIKELPLRTVLWSIGALLTVTFVAAATSLIVTRQYRETKTSALLEKLQYLSDQLERKLALTQELSRNWERLNEWTVPESHVLEIERDWKGSVWILVPDLYYELDAMSELPRIIADNICKSAFKEYVYFLPETHSSVFMDLRKRIKIDLRKRGQPEIYADTKFKCCSVPKIDFPFAATAGVVLYTDCDDRTDLAYSHLPVVFPTSPLNIQLNREDDHNFYTDLKSNLRTYLETLRGRYPPQ